MIKVGNILIDPNDISSIHLDKTPSCTHRDRGNQIIQIIYKNGVVKNFIDKELGMSYDEFIQTLVTNQDKEETDRIFRLMAAIKSMNNE
jgi:hypothetical protein